MSLHRSWTWVIGGHGGSLGVGDKVCKALVGLEKERRVFLCADRQLEEREVGEGGKGCNEKTLIAEVGLDRSDGKG